MDPFVFLFLCSKARRGHYNFQGEGDVIHHCPYLVTFESEKGTIRQAAGTTGVIQNILGKLKCVGKSVHRENSYTL